jgi:translation initiation factor 2 subunit 2
MGEFGDIKKKKKSSKKKAAFDLEAFEKEVSRSVYGKAIAGRG